MALSAAHHQARARALDWLDFVVGALHRIRIKLHESSQAELAAAASKAILEVEELQGAVRAWGEPN